MRRHSALFIFCIAIAACRSDSPRDPGTSADSSASTASAQVIRVQDDAGRTVELAHPAMRVISMIPAQTEVVKILGGVERVIARTQWDVDPDLASLPSTGNALTPSVEWLTAQHPDLVIVWPDNASRNITDQLRPVGIPVYASSVESLDDIRSMVRRIGTLLGRDARADSLVRAIDAQLDSVRASVAGLNRPSVMYVLSIDPPMTTGGSTYVSSVIDAAGGRNAFGDLTAPWPQISLEEVVRRQPDMLLLPTGESGSSSARMLRNKPGWRELRAVREGRVYEVDANLFDRPGVTVGRIARTTAALLHGDSVGVAARRAAGVLHGDSVTR